LDFHHSVNLAAVRYRDSIPGLPRAVFHLA
jgi:hypothetical protein